MLGTEKLMCVCCQGIDSIINAARLAAVELMIMCSCRHPSKREPGFRVKWLIEGIGSLD